MITTEHNIKDKNLEEVNHYKDYAFPVEVFTVTRESIVPHGRGFLDLHWHNELQFSYVLVGSMTMQVNGIKYEIKAGSAIFINRNILHITTELSDDGRYVSLNFPDKLLGFFTGSRMEQNAVIPFTSNYAMPAVFLDKEVEWQASVIDRLLSIIDMCHEMEKNRDNYSEYRISLGIVNMWYDLISHVDLVNNGSKWGYLHKQERIRAMLSYIHNHYMEPIRLKDIANAASVSEGECCRCFKEMICQSTSQYLITYRIMQAMEMLRKTEDSITSIAEKCGFNDSSHFTHCFRSKTGMTPKEYRNKNN